LYPKSGNEAQLKPGSATRIPAAGQWFRLDKETGQEDLFIYAAHQPLAADDLQARMTKDAAVVKPAAAPAKKKPRPRHASADADAPGGLGGGTRGMTEETEDPAQVDQNGVTTSHFAIRHKK
jgi:hypothetical protein